MLDEQKMGLHKLSILSTSEATQTSSPHDLANVSDEDSDRRALSDDSSSTGEDDDDDWNDWDAGSDGQDPCISLFDKSKFSTAEKVVEYDKEKYGFDLDGTCKRLSAFSRPCVSRRSCR